MSLRFLVLAFSGGLSGQAGSPASGRCTEVDRLAGVVPAPGRARPRLPAPGVSRVTASRRETIARVRSSGVRDLD